MKMTRQDMERGVTILKPFAIESVEPTGEAGPILEVRIAGYLDAHTVDAFEQTAERLLSQPQNKVILNIAELSYISSAGIGALMVFLQQLRRREGDMVLLQPVPKVLKVLDLLGFTRIFAIAQDREAARKTLGC
jgi:anti-anti-sigma factor